MNLDGGLFFEASSDGQVKIYNKFPDFTHKVTPPNSRRGSAPRSHALSPDDAMPQQSGNAIWVFLAKSLPTSADQPFVVEKLVDTHMVHARRVLATGDFGNAFKRLPVMGKYIAGLVEGK
ncbi:hypothetical protein BJY00DRAFT_317374 [Aspergillus carlsbadensis]|nr:hypothetical protein BJY00DRAFT_317374 [Aspergillus carlsbadensis]